MNTILRYGLLLGILVVGWTFVMGLTGWYKDPRLVAVFFVVIPIEIGVLVMGLRETARQGRRYAGQVVAGTLMAVVASVLIFAGSMTFTTVVYPRYFDEIAAAEERMLVEAGKSPEQAHAEAQAHRRAASSTGNAMNGVVGTVVTGLVVSLVTAAFVRAKR